MRNDPVISVDEFEEARESADEMWSDFEVFEEERDSVPLQHIVFEVVEGQYTHPAGPDSMYGLEGSAQDLVWDKVFSSGLVPEGIPTEVRERFARELGSEVSECSTELYDRMRDVVDPESDVSLERVQEVMEDEAEGIVSESY